MPPILDVVFRRRALAKPSSETFKGWGFVLVMGTILAVVAMIDRGDLGDGLTAEGSEASSGCRLVVTVPELNVRAGSGVETDLIATLELGDEVEGTRDVVDGFRRLEGDRWATDSALDPLPDANC